jgi:hypothetical protein
MNRAQVSLPHRPAVLFGDIIVVGLVGLNIETMWCVVHTMMTLILVVVVVDGIVQQLSNVHIV